MTLSAASVHFGKDGPVLQPGPTLPLAALVIGKSVEEVAALLPRLFNLCRAAQGVAARLALGLPDEGADLGAEIVRDHVVKLCVTLPQAFGQATLSVPASATALLGPKGLPDACSDLDHWDSPAAALARTITRLFPDGTATTDPLPPAPPLAEGAYENSAPGRQAGHPLMRDAEGQTGRGPLWRYLGILVDLQAALQKRMPAPEVRDGVATVPAARGTYALRITQAEGRVSGIERRTPTDHLLAPGGALLQALTRLPVHLRPLAPQVIALHDPCIPVTLREAQNA